MATVKENLIAAKALIDTPEKWTTGVYVRVDGCRCVVGALAKATNLATYNAELSDEYRGLMAAIPHDRADEFGMLHEFNDDPATTHADIMALFDRAIAAQDA